MASSSGGGLSSGSSGAAYSGGGGGGSSGERSSSGYQLSSSQAEAERIRRLLLAQQAAAAAQKQAFEGTGTAAPATTTGLVQTPAPSIFPTYEGGMWHEPAKISPPQAIDVNPLAQTTTTATPYGDITVTRPVGAPTLQTGPVNPLARPQGALESRLATPQGQAAEAYRNLPTNATPQERSLVLEAYRGALGTPATRENAQLGGIRETNLAQDWTRQGLGADEVAQRLAEYKSMRPDQQAREYYNVRSGIERPNQIGGATMVAGPDGTRRLNVPSLGDEAAARSDASKLAKAVNNMRREAHDLEFPRDAKGNLVKPTEADRKEAAENRVAADKLAAKAGLEDPRNPRAGLNPASAAMNLLGSSRGTLDEVAKLANQKLELQAKGKEQVAREQEVKPSEKTQKELEASTRERTEKERNDFLDELRRRQGRLFANR